MAGQLLETITQYYRIDRREIAFLKFILEAYDGIAVLTTIDAEAGHIFLRIAPGCKPDVDRLIDELKKDIMIEPLADVSVDHIY